MSLDILSLFLAVSVCAWYGSRLKFYKFVLPWKRRVNRNWIPHVNVAGDD